MLYDPKWEPETKADPLTLTALIAWLEKKPAGEIYCYIDQGKCLAAQYNKEIGRKYKVRLIRDPSAKTSFDNDLEWIAVIGTSTFGAALKRAREVALSKG